MFQISHLKLYRLDFCFDIEWISPSHLKTSSLLIKKYKKPIATFENPLWWNNYMNWFNLLFLEHEFKAYDKVIDVIENWKADYDPQYKKYKDSDKYITRCEIKINNRWLKKFDFSDFHDIYSFGEKKLSNFMRKYFIDVYEVYKSDYMFERKVPISVPAIDFNILIKTYNSYFLKIKDLYKNKTAKFYDSNNILQDNTKLWKQIISQKLLKMRDEIDEMLFEFPTK